MRRRRARNWRRSRRRACVVALERRLAAMASRKHAVAVNSGTDALHFALLAAGIRKGDEVLVTDFSFVSSGSAIAMASATPIFVDVGDSYNMDLNRAEQYISPKTRGIIFVHLYGQMSEPLEITGVCPPTQFDSNRGCSAGDRRLVRRSSSRFRWSRKLPQL